MQDNRSVKAIAFYLPQFHRIPENDEWWGEGFTEWTNVRKAQSLFVGHRQPRTAGELGYYDLSTTDVMHQQIALAKEYGIFGFCFYHYWFRGKKLLEKPVENFLRESSLNMPFCLCWANEPWTRTWDGFDRGVLQEQDYGNESDWRDHFAYLLPFLSDRRYIHVDGKPIILLYRIGHVPQPREMFAVWREEAARAGLPGLHIVTALNTGFGDDAHFEHTGVDAVYEFAPYSVPSHATMHSGVETRRYDAVWGDMLRQEKVFPVQYRGAFVDWDNTPRKQSDGRVFVGSTPEKFEKYLTKQFARVRCDRSQHEFVFINAWNEWAEGCALEPDGYYGRAYLEAVRRAHVRSLRFSTRVSRFFSSPFSHANQ